MNERTMVKETNKNHINLEEATSIIEKRIEEIAKKNDEPSWVTEKRYEGLEAFKKAPNQDPILNNLTDFTGRQNEVPVESIDSLEDLPSDMKKLLDELGINEEEQKFIAGLTSETDTGVVQSDFMDKWEEKGLTIAPMEEAVKEFPQVKEHFMELFDPTENKLAAYHTAVWDGGIFLHLEEGLEVDVPLQLFYLIQESSLAQAPHIMIMAEPNSKVHLMEGCTSPVLAKHSLHLDMTEAFIKDNAEVKLTVLQNWPQYVHTRPKTRAKVGKEASFKNTTVGLGPGKSNISNPKYWVDEEGTVEMNTIILGKEDSDVSVGGEINLEGKGSSGINESKAVIMDEASVVSEGVINALEEETEGHIGCDALTTSPNASMETYPGLASEVSNTDLSHEAGIGNIREKELFYLQSRGLTEEEATQLIVKGFVSPLIEDIPLEFKSEIKKIIEMSVNGSL